MAYTKLILKSNNIRVAYVLKFLSGLVFFLPVLALYFEKELFTLTNVALIFSIGAIAQTLLEVPTGAVADYMGRKKTLILSHISFIIALIFLFIGGNITLFIIYALFNALADSLWSGTMGALMYDTLKSEKKESFFKKVSGKASAFSHAGVAVGSIVSGYLAAVSLKLPILLTFIPAIVGLIATSLVIEPVYHRDEHKNIFAHLKKSASYFFINKQLLLIVVGLFFIAAVFNSLTALNPIWYQFKNIPIESFGWIAALLFTLAAIGYHESHKFSDWLGDKNAIMVTVLLPPITILTATFFDKYVSIALILLSPLFFGLRTPILDNLIHKNTESKHRATLISMVVLIKKSGYAIFAIILGYVAEAYTINVAFQLAALLLFVVPILYYFLKEK
jgi:MFS family permease